jgi:hypothetical protein
VGRSLAGRQFYQISPSPPFTTTTMNQVTASLILELAATIIEKSNPAAAEHATTAANAVYLAEKATARAEIETDEVTVTLLNLLAKIQHAAARSALETALDLLKQAA